MGRARVPAGDHRPADARRTSGGNPGATAAFPAGLCSIHARLAARRIRAERLVSGRVPDRPGGWRRRDAGDQPGAGVGRVSRARTRARARHGAGRRGDGPGGRANRGRRGAGGIELAVHLFHQCAGGRGGGAAGIPCAPGGSGRARWQIRSHRQRGPDCGAGAAAVRTQSDSNQQPGFTAGGRVTGAGRDGARDGVAAAASRAEPDHRSAALQNPGVQRREFGVVSRVQRGRRAGAAVALLSGKCARPRGGAGGSGTCHHPDPDGPGGARGRCALGPVRAARGRDRWAGRCSPGVWHRSQR